jgi:DNA-binding beta-propeller fold protein YncE
VIDLNKKKSLKFVVGTESIAITPDGSEIWVTNTKDNSITVIKTSNYKLQIHLMTGETFKT